MAAADVDEEKGRKRRQRGGGSEGRASRGFTKIYFSFSAFGSFLKMYFMPI